MLGMSLEMSIITITAMFCHFRSHHGMPPISMAHGITSSAGSSRGHLYLQLCDLVSQTAISEVMASVNEANCEQFYQYYLHDFVRSVHRCLHRHQKSEKLEYKVCKML